MHLCITHRGNAAVLSLQEPKSDRAFLPHDHGPAETAGSPAPGRGLCIAASGIPGLAVVAIKMSRENA